MSASSKNHSGHSVNAALASQCCSAFLLEVVAVVTLLLLLVWLLRLARSRFCCGWRARAVIDVLLWVYQNIFADGALTHLAQ